MIYSGEKEKIRAEKGKIFPAIGAAFILALAPTVALVFILFALFGSSSFINTIFSLNIKTSQLVLLTIAFFVYLYTIDNIIEFAVNYILGKLIFSLVIVLLVRILALYTIGLIFNLNQTSNFTIALIISSIIFFVEIIQLSKKSKKPKFTGICKLELFCLFII